MGTIRHHLLMKQLQESALSRIWQYVEDDTKSFGIISAYRFGNDDNKKIHIQLKNRIRELHFGFILLKGGYREEAGDFSSEISFFIPNIDKKTLIKLGCRYNQDSVIYKDTNEFVLIGTNNDTGVGTILKNYRKSVGKENINTTKDAIKDFYSQLLKGAHRDIKFTFRLEEYKELGWMMRMGGYMPFWFDILEDIRIESKKISD